MTAYQRIADSLRRRLLTGQWRPGQQLPTERELCRRFAASQITVRRAMQILEQENLVERRQGSGTFATPTTARKIPILNADFLGSIRRHAPRLERKLIIHRWETLDASLADIMQACIGDPVLRAVRIDFLHGKPVALDEVTIPERLARRLVEDDLWRIDFLQRWQQLEKLPLGRCEQSIEAVKATAPLSRHLKVRPGQPLLKETSLMYLVGGQPAGLFVTYYRHDSFRFEAVFDFGQTNRTEERT